MNNIKFDVNEIIKDSIVRKRLTFESHKYFFSIYFNSYITHESADFHDKIFDITENEKIKNGLILAFRGSAKSTILTTSYPIWAILGKPQKKFVVIVSQTQRQARQHLENIKRELTNNSLLKDDLGPFKEISETWRSMSLAIENFNAKITAVSMEQTIRGMKYMSHRPDLIICDDIEDLTTIKTQEGRDKIFDWITGEIIPAGDIDTKTIFVGNLLHEDSPIVRIKNKIENNEIDGVSLEIPLLDEKGNIAWPGKYPNMESIEEERRKIMDDYAWNREYLLKIISRDSQIIKPEWINYYNNLPISPDKRITKILVGVDLAISQNANADCTAMVPVAIFHSKPYPEIYVLSGIINEKISFKDILDKAKDKNDYLKNLYRTNPLFLIEKNGFQDAATQEIKRKGVYAEGIMTSIEKSERLTSVSHLFQEGKVFFPKKEAELLIKQLTGFGSEKHDDLSDALVISLEYALKHKFGIGGATTDINRKTNFFTPSYQMTMEQKKERYRRLEYLNNRGFFLR